jgi:hypothetical protein
MKTKLSTLFLSAAMAATFTACGGEPAPAQDPAAAAGLAGAPMWVLDPSVDGGVAAVGSAQKSPGGLQFQRTEALANARDELARILSVKVNNMVKNFSQATGVGDAQTFEKVAQQVSKQVASQTLSGSKQKAIWINPVSGELFVHVILDPEAVKAAAKSSVMTSMQNDQALWQQFQAKKADDALDAEVDKLAQ